MRKGDSLHLRGEENAGFPLQTHGRNPEAGTTDKAGGSPNKRVSGVAKGASYRCSETGGIMHPGHEREHTLIGQTLLDGVDVFGTLFEPEYESHEYISTRSSGYCTGRNGRRNNEGRDFSRDPRPVSLSGLLCSGWSALLLVFLSLSRAVPKLSLSTRPQRYRLSGVSDKAIQAPSPGGLAYAPDNQWLVANGKKGGGMGKSPPSRLIKG